MHRQKIGPGLGYLSHRPFHGLADVVQLQIDEYAVTLGLQLADEVHSRRGIQFQSDFVE